MRLKQYLTEKTFNIDRDVKWIYDKYFKDFIKDWNAGKISTKEFTNILKKYKTGPGVAFGSFSSDKLKEKECKAAHLLNPVTIYCGIARGAFYDIEEKTIWISLPVDVMFMQSVGSKPPEETAKYFEAEISEGRMKSTIYHELSHWLNDSLHNFHISTVVSLAKELGKPEIKMLGRKDVNITHFERDAQIHGIKAIKKVYKDEWDEFTLDDLFEKNPSLWAVASTLKTKHGDKVLNLWQKLLIKRMARENLLGKNMKTFAKIKHPMRVV